jgi:hypothetical protein
MIRAGRKVVDIDGIAELRRVSSRTASRHKPWDEPEHPAPVNKDSARPGVGGRSGRKRLWDRAQVAAYVAGRRVPALPVTDDEHDLLDAAEAAAAREMTVAVFNALVRDGKLAGPDAQPCGEPHWYRVTVEAMRPEGREPGPPTREEAERIHERIAEALERVPRRAGGKVNVAAVAREARVARPTALRHIRLMEQGAHRVGATPE